MTNLERLNQLLKNHQLKLPMFRTNVDKSGSNLHWLRKHVLTNPHASEELKMLLNSNIVKLLQQKS